jgi:hypothetical protein
MGSICERTNNGNLFQLLRQGKSSVLIAKQHHGTPCQFALERDTFGSVQDRIYSATVLVTGNLYRCHTQVSIPSAAVGVTLKLGQDGSVEMASTEIGRGVDTDQLTNKGVSEIPLNKRDFSQILLLAAGTSSDTNGTSNFTQQFAINGQRGVEAAFSLDGADISDPEVGGGTFTNSM